MVEVRRKVNVLRIDQGEHNGTEARFLEMTSGQVADMTAMAGALDMGGGGDPTLKPEHANVLADMFGLMAAGLQSWNLEDRDTNDQLVPIDADLGGIRSLPWSLTEQLIELWMTGATVAAPLGAGSPNGGPPLGLELPMEPLSESPPP